MPSIWQKWVRESQEAGRCRVWVKVRASPARVGRRTGHTDKDTSWKGVAGVGRNRSWRQAVFSGVPGTSQATVAQC